MATPTDETIPNSFDKKDEFLAEPIQGVDILNNHINDLKDILSSGGRVAGSVLAELSYYESRLREDIKVARGLGIGEKDLKPSRKVLQKCRRFRVHAQRARSRDFLEGFFACENLSRQVLGAEFCREFDELSLSR
jgi:hypothetical protein